MNALFGQRWNQLVLFVTWSLSLLFFYAYMDSRLTKVHRDYAVVWKGIISKLSRSTEKNFGQPAAISSSRNSALGSEATKSLNEDNLIIMYNRVPKTASTSFMGVTFELCKTNGFSSIHLNISRNSHTMSLADQWTFVKNISNWVQRKPAIYHGHVAFIDFRKFGQRNPIYINLIRDPLERMISYYYFLRFGDDFRPHLIRRRQGDKETTFDECVERNGKDCDPSQMWVQIPFFCGHTAECWIPGNRFALEQAKSNLVNNYLLVGITDELQDFLAILEATLPRFFAGATDKYYSGRKSHLRKTNKKIPPSEETLNKIQKSIIWQMEQEFFDFAKEQFQFIKNKILRYDHNGQPILPSTTDFHYDKIKP